jgi:hypothetical protein
MSLPTIKSLGNLDADVLIPQLQLRVKKAFMPNRSKAGASRKWKMQAAILQDATGEIRATFWNREIDFRDLEGHEISIKSAEERGITTLDYEDKKTGEVSRQLNVEKESEVDEVVDSQSENEPPTSKASNGKPEPQRIRTYENESVKRESIERQAALAQAVLLANDSNPDTVIKVAEKFYDFLSARKPVVEPDEQLGPTAAPEPAPEPDEQVL